MARSWQYSRYRRAMMQGVMWVVLGATVGLAGLQARQRPSSPHVSVPMRVYTLGQWGVRVPEDWVASKPGGRVMEFREPLNPEARTGEEEGGRELAVERDSVDPSTTSPAYLADKLHVEELTNPKLIPMCGQQGVMVLVPGSSDEEGSSIYAASVLPNGDAITVQLSMVRPVTQEDLELAETIASTIMHKPISDQPRQSPRDVQKPDRPQGPDDGD